MVKHVQRFLLLAAMLALAWTAQGQEPDLISTFPYTCDFESSGDSALWVTLNGTQENGWYIGTATNATPSGSYSLYVSNNSGTSNTYDVNSASASYTWAYERFSFAVGSYHISFNWRCLGEIDSDPYDYFRVFIVPDTTTLTAGALPSTSYTWSNQFMSDVPTGWIGINGTNTYFCSQNSYTTLNSEFNITTADNYKLVFLWLNDDNTFNNPPAAIDDITISVNSCPRPSGLTVEYVTADSVTLSWSSIGTESEWLLSDGTNEYHAYDTTYTFDNLSAYTVYNFSVRALCSASDTSTALYVSVRTACGDMSTLPFFENFESAPSGSSTTGSAFVDCWGRLNNGTSYGGYPYVSSSSTYNHTPGGTMGLYWYNTTTTGTYGDYQCIVLPPLDTVTYPVSNVELLFWAKASSTSYHPPMQVGVMTDPTDINSFQLVQTVNVNPSNTTNWEQYSVDFSDFTGSGKFIAIKAVRASWTAYVDDIMLRERNDCPMPENLTTLNSTVADSVVIGWNTDGFNQLFDIAVGAPGFDPDTVSDGNLISFVTDSTYTFTNLQGGVTYQVYVRTVCSTGESYWAGPLTLSPGSMNMTPTGTNSVYMCGGTIYDDGGPTGEYSMSCNSTLYVYPSDSTKTLVVSGVSYTESSFDYLRIYEGIGTSGTVIFDDYGVSATQHFGPYVTGGEPITIVFHSDGSIAYSGYEINISCVDLPDCHRPNTFELVSLLPDTVEFAWDDPDGSEWLIAYGPTGFNRYDTEDTSVHWMNVYTPQVVIDGLIPNTTYDFYLMAYCGGDTSLARTMTLHTPCLAFPTDSLPYHYGFEDATSGTSGHLNSCWQKGNRGVSSYYPYVSTSYHAEGSKSLYFYGYSSTYYSYVTMPMFEAPLSDLMISFKLYKTSSTYGSIEVGVMVDPSDVNTFTSLGTFQADQTSTWESFTTTLRNYNGNGRFITFMQRSTYYTYLDDITVELAPPCPPPTNVTVANTSVSSAYVTWRNQVGFPEVPAYYEVTWVDSLENRVSDTTSNMYYMISGLDPVAEYRVVVTSYWNDDPYGSDSTDFTTSGYGCAVADSANMDSVIFSTGTSQTSGVPVNSSWGNTLCQSIYTAAELTAAGLTAGNISGIDLGFTQNSSYAKELSVYISTISRSTFSSESDMENLNNQMLVYGPAAHPLNTVGTQHYDFDASFSWDGVSNIAITFLMNQPTGNSHSSSSFYGYSTSTSSTVTVYSYQDGTQYTPANCMGGNRYTSTYRPSITFYRKDCLVPATCAAPLVQVISRRDTVVEIIWGAGGDESAWDVEHRVEGASTWTMDAFSTSATSWVFSGLTPNTKYEFRVSHNCTGIDYATTVTATTPCVPTSVPLYEHFNTWSTSSTDPGPSCWHKNSTYNATYPYVSTGYSSDGDGRSLYFYTSSSAYTALVLPVFDVPLDSLTLSFALLSSTTSYSHTLQVGVITDPEDITTFQAIGTAAPPATTYVWNRHEFSFHGLGFTEGQIAIRTAPGSYAYPYLDEIEVDYYRSCARPSNVRATNVTQNTATIAWTDTNALDYEYEYGISGFTPGTGTIGTVTGNTINLTGLAAGRNYDFIVRGICDAGDTSNRSFRFTFATQCGNINSLPYFEDFNSWGTGSSVHAPNCWSYGSDYSTSYPYIYDYRNYSGSYGGSMYMYNSNSSNPNSLTYFSLPQIDSTLGNVSDMQVVFYATTTTSSYVHQVVVGVCTTPGLMSTFTPIDTVVARYNEWDMFEIPFDSYTGTGRYITFASAVASGYNYSYPYVDDITVEYIPSCQRPDSLTASNATTSTVDLQWRPRTEATNFIIEYGPLGFQLGTGTVLNVNTNPYTLTGLPASYDGEYYVRNICSSTDTSEYSRTPGRFSTSQMPATIPYQYSFEDSTEWTAWQTNSNTTINWYRGNAVTPYDSSYCMYVSPDGGATFGTNMTAVVNTAVWRDVDFGTIDTSFEISFKYKVGGTLSARYDGMMVFLVDPSVPVVASDAGITSPWGNVNDLYRIVNVRLDTAWTTAHSIFDTIHGVKRVAFFWFNQNTGDSYPWIFGPAAVDDLHIDYSPCPRPLNLAVDTASVTSTTARVFWQGSPSAQYRVAYRVGGAPASTNVYVNTNTNSLVLTGLSPMTTYYVWVQKLCGSDSSLFSDGVEFQTDMCEDMADVYNYDASMSTTTSSYGPIGYATYNYSYVQTIIDSAHMAGMTEPITAFAFNATNNTSSNYYTGMDVYMANIPESDLSSGFILPNTTTHQFVQVVSNGDFNFTDAGWQVHAFDTTFTWDGHSNVLFAVNRHHGSWSSSTSFAAHSTSTIRTRYSYQDSGPISINDGSATSTGSGSYVGDLRFISCGVTPVCHEPIITSVTKTYHSATVNWIGDGNNYEVNIKESTATNWPATDIAVTGNSYTFTGLNPTTNYTFRVRQDCTADSMAYSEWVIDGVLTDSLPCLPPDSLHVTAVTNATATFDWSVNGNENVWDIHVWYGSFDSIYRTILRPATVGGFTAGLTYNAAIRPVCGITLLEGDWSDTVQFTTAVCPDITGLSTSNVTTNSVTLNWSSNPMALRWNIEYGPTGFTQGQGTQAVSNTNSYVVTGLSDGITYDFYVKAVCGDDWTSENWVGTSATTQEGTIPCDAPTGVGTAVADNSVTVNWTAGTGNISFELEYGPRGFSHGAGSTTTATGSPAVIANLDYETQYDVYVRAVCEQNIFSPWSTVSTFTTGERPSEDCDPVQNLTVTNVTETSADVSWQPGPTGDHWQVVLTDGAGSTISDNVTAERQATFSNLTPGTNYTVKVRTDCGDGNYSAYVTANFRTLGGEGIEEVEGINCRIFPNPATSSTTISVTGVNGTVRIAVVDMNGRTVATETLECSADCEKTMEVDKLAQGAYFVRITADNTNMVRKLIVR